MVFWTFFGTFELNYSTEEEHETNMPLEIISKVVAQKGMNCNEVEIREAKI